MSHLTLPLLFAFILPALAQQQPMSVTEMLDRYRPLLIFQNDKDERLAEQLRFLTPHRADLIDRQLMLVLRPYALAGPVDNDTITIRGGEEDKELRQRFHIHPKDFTVILLGKDGGEKFRAHTPVTIEQLVRFIDAMPMRQSEMRARHPH